MSRQPANRPENLATRDVTAAIQAIEPSRTPRGEIYYPCEMLLTSGCVLPRVICRPHVRWSDKGDWIKPSRIATVRPSNKRLPAPLAEKLYRAGESGQGYLIYTLHLRDGNRFACLSAGIVDFPWLPEGAATSDILDVSPHQGRDWSVHTEPEFVWCDFTPFGDPA